MSKVHFVDQLKKLAFLVLGVPFWLLVGSCSSSENGDRTPKRASQQSVVVGEGKCRTSTLTVALDYPVDDSWEIVGESSVSSLNPLYVHIPSIPEVVASDDFVLRHHEYAVIINGIDAVDGYFYCSSYEGMDGKLEPFWCTSAAWQNDPAHLFTLTYLSVEAGTISGTGDGPYDEAISFRVSLSPTVTVNTCLVTTCDPATGPTSLPAAAGTLCSDGNACNGLETCNGTGTCVGGTSLANGTSCSDGDACNGQETCRSGICAPGAALTVADYDDHNPCTDDACVDGHIVNSPNDVCTSPPTPVVDPTSSPDFASSTEFLYTGVSAIQTGVAPGTIDPERAGVIRGRVLASDGATAYVGAVVSIVGHPEYGSTLTRSDGYYDLAINGGGIFTVDVTGTVTIPVQRTVHTKLHGWTIVDDVVLTTPLTSVDTFTPGAAAGTLVRGATTSSGEDADGARRATLYFRPGTTIIGHAGPSTALNVGITEFTRGANGPQRMPGDLPPTSGYTYALELSLSDANGLIADPHFSTPVSLYVDNFTGYPVGEDVPLGAYDRTKGVWKGAPSGRILKVLAVAGGVPSIDLTGDGVAESVGELNAFGIEADERAALGAEFPAGTELWRSPLEHFSSWDCNWPFGPPPNAPPPPVPPPPNDDDPPDPCETEGSIIGCESRTLGEELAIVGTPYKLRYQSNRTTGFQSRLSIKVSKDAVTNPDFLKAHVTIDVAGRHFEYTRGALGALEADQGFTWAWDGVDAYGRVAPAGTYDAKVRVGYEYKGTETLRAPSFGAVTPGATITGDRLARTVTLWKEATYPLRRASAEPLGFGGWTLDVNHMLDGDNATLYRGDGKRRELKAIDMVTTVAGGGSSEADGVLATTANLHDITGFALAADGSLYIARYGFRTNGQGGVIRRVAPSGIITTVAGGIGVTTPKTDGGPALGVTVWPTSLALGPEGDLYFTEYNQHQVWKVSFGPTAATLHHVAGIAGGTNSNCPSSPPDLGDNGEATCADIVHPFDVQAGSDGAVFIADYGHHRVRRVGPEGVISTHFLSTTVNPNLWFPVDLSLRPDGVIFARGNTYYRIEPSGSATPILEPGTTTPLSIQTHWCAQAGGAPDNGVIALPDDSFLATCYGKVIRRDATGAVFRHAGHPTEWGFAGDSGPALQARFQLLNEIGLAPNNDIYVVDNSSRIRRIRPSLPTGSLSTRLIPSEDGREVYEFDVGGKHLRTLTGLTGAPLLTFGYDTSTGPNKGTLTSVTDQDGNETTVARNGSTITVTAPHGQLTTLTLDAQGHLASVTNPAVAETTQLGHTSEGLLTDLVDARGHAHHFEYTSDGRLSKDIDATPGSLGKRLVTTADDAGWWVELTTPEGRVTRHRIERGTTAVTEGSLGREHREITNAAGLVTRSDRFADGSSAVTRPDGIEVTVEAVREDPRLGSLVTYPSRIKTQAGVAPNVSTSWRTEERSATLGTTGDPFSVTSETITTKLWTSAPPATGGTPVATSTRVFTAGSPSKWTTTSFAGRVTEEELDAHERVTKSRILGSSPVTLAPVEYAYDLHGRLVTMTHGSRVYTTNYNATTGWIDSTTAPEGLGLSYTLRDANGRPKTIVLPGTRQVGITYDVAGNVTSITPPSKPAHDSSFDENDRLASYEPPDLIPSLAPKDTLYARDKDGLLTFLSQPGKPVTYAYDGLGRSRSVTDAVTKTFGYDTVGRLATVTTSDGVTLTNTYSGPMLVGQSVSGPFSHQLTKTYDTFDRLTSIEVDTTGALAFSRDWDGYVTSASGMTVSRSTNGLLTSTSIGSVSETFGYNTYGERTSHVVSGAAYGCSVDLSNRDTAGRIHTKSETINGTTHTFTYDYDAAGRLANVYLDGATLAARSYTYDANGNRQDGVHSATYDDQDRLTSFGTLAYAYGNNGELAKVTDTSGIAPYPETLYDYDAQGNLRGVTPPAPAAPITYVIDGFNRRIGKKVSGSLVQGFLYDGERVVAELDATGAIVARFVYATGSHAPDLMLKAGSTYRFVKDHLGGPRLVVKTSDGSIAQRLDYDEWGNVTADSNAGFQPFGFAGGLWDRDTNFIRFGARDYDPTTGRWVSKDRARFAGGLNLYVYCNGDSINLIDPKGNYAVTPPATTVVVGGAGGLWGGFAIGAGAIVVAATWDILHQLDDYEHPTIGGPGGGSGAGPGGSAPGGGAGGGQPGRGPGGTPGAGSGAGAGASPYRTPYRPPDYPQCAGLTITQMALCCRKATGFGGDIDMPPEPCDKSRGEYEKCMDENGW